MRILMIGTGYVGLVTGTCLAEIGHTVTCIDLDEGKIKKLTDGISPIYEPGLEAMIRQNIEHDRLFFSTELASGLGEAEIAFIAVGTPEGENGSADLGYVLAAAKQIGEQASGDLLVIVKSTVPVGTCALVEAEVKKALKGRQVDHKITVASNPEFLKEGNAVTDFMRPERIIVGVDNQQDEAKFRKMYRPFVLDDPSKLMVMDRSSSELTKYGSNAMLATRISFMNELAELCEKVGADVDNVRRGMGEDPRIGKKFLYAGPGYGGSCFPKDVLALLKSGETHDVGFEVLQAVTRVNDAQKLRAAARIHKYYKDLRGKKIAVWGLAFKPGTDDVREAPSLTIVSKLIEWGASVVVHDPQAIPNFKRQFGDHDSISYVDDAYTAVEGSDGLVLVTEWSEYRRPNWEKVTSLMRHKAVFDLRNQYEGPTLTEAGYFYRCIGRPDSTTTLT